MWAAIFQKVVFWQKERKVVAVEVTFNSDANTYSSLELIEKKGIVNIGESIEATEDSEHIFSKILPDSPVTLSLTGRGILHKKVNINNSSDDALAALVLPNAKSQDYFIQKVSCGSDYIVSIIRRSQLEEALTLFKKQNLTVVSVSLGPFGITSIFPIIEHNEIYTGSFLIKKEDGLLSHFEPNKLNSSGIKIGDDTLLPYQTVMFANALQFLKSDLEQSFLTLEEVEKNKDEFYQKHYFIFFGWALLLFFLLVLLINFLFFSHYDSKNKELSQHELSASGNVSAINSLSKELNDKEQFLETAGWMGKSSSAFYADRIAASVPSQIQLSELKIHPLDEAESRKLKKSVFQPKVISLSGTTTASTVLTTWIKQLSDIEGIESAQIKKYAHDDKTSVGVFEILITHHE